MLNTTNDFLVIPPLPKGNLSIENDLHFQIDQSIAKKIRENPTTQFLIKARFLGSKENLVSLNIPVDNFEFNEMLLPNFSRNVSIPFNFTQKNNSIHFPPGSIKVEKDIFIPSGFEVNIAPDTKLQFAEDVTFISESPIFAKGKLEKPIVFQGIENGWPGILVSKTSDISIFENVKFQDVRGIGKSANPDGLKRSGWNLTGGVTFFRSSVSLENCIFNNFSSEDALNIISTSFSMTNCSFKSAFSDAFDGDFVNGIVKDCRFEDISGDGVDFSGSTAKVVNSEFINISDKAVSIGEQSNVQVLGATINDVLFGVVSKDSSFSTIRNSSVDNARKAAFSAFQKKASFGPAKIEVFKSKSTNCSLEFLIQDKSLGIKDRSLVKTSNFQTTSLYER